MLRLNSKRGQIEVTSGTLNRAETPSGIGLSLALILETKSGCNGASLFSAEICHCKTQDDGRRVYLLLIFPIILLTQLTATSRVLLSLQRFIHIFLLASRRCRSSSQTDRGESRKSEHGRTIQSNSAIELGTAKTA